jgi:hypothetical protein
MRWPSCILVDLSVRVREADISVPNSSQHFNYGGGVLFWLYIMFVHLVHLLVRSFLGIPGALGSTALGVLFPLFIAIVGEVIGVWRFGWAEMARNWRKATSAGFAALAVGYAILFSFLVIKNIYGDHVALVQKLAAGRRLSSGLDASIAMIVEGAGSNGGLMIFTSINLANGIGPERPLRNWNLEIVVDGKKVEPIPLPFPGAEMSIPVPQKSKTMIFNEKDYCPFVTENPLPSGANRYCWMMSYFDVDVKKVARKNISAIVSFKDLANGEVHELKTDIGPSYNDFPWSVPKR